MNIYIFSSKNLTNIWAGVGAKKWAISKDQAEMSGTQTKASRMRVGMIGIIYCVETQSFTSPFLISSTPNASEVIKHIWPEEWHFPFGMMPLGSPAKQISKSEIATLPVVVKSGRQWNNVLPTQGQFVFQPAQIEVEDWEFIFEKLKSD